MRDQQGKKLEEWRRSRIVRLSRSGWPIKRIARETGHDRKTVRKYIRRARDADH